MGDVDEYLEIERKRMNNWVEDVIGGVDVLKGRNELIKAYNSHFEFMRAKSDSEAMKHLLNKRRCLMTLLQMARDYTMEKPGQLRNNKVRKAYPELLRENTDCLLDIRDLSSSDEIAQPYSNK